MTPNNNQPNLQVEIITPPAVNNLNVVQVGQNMFSINLGVMLVIRFPGDIPSDQTSIGLKVAASALPQVVSVTPETPGKLMYGDGTTPEAGDETTAFQDFTTQHGYPPPTQAVLVEWINLTTAGGA